MNHLLAKKHGGRRAALTSIDVLEAVDQAGDLPRQLLLNTERTRVEL